ncbi:nucleotidyltransferase domain-containing protein [Streptomyces ipomoeae]|uniref:Nucleotidyltransferase domain-containing protein n=1 Tax=Streptomyces ipomoeae TaxID=103232 RepID=A0A540PMK2_9ACTN|nr:nucleotidyltransferase domain-containing protein [Streptomyces ipomoeae]TQE24414.1 nucleotidyltransferase domain-containing protein [Streptomyces ipomoeae]TQE25117.1 nucleotidyltransferase domain-containing protein [Streptomyces ipomoeae]
MGRPLPHVWTSPRFTWTAERVGLRRQVIRSRAVIRFRRLWVVDRLAEIANRLTDVSGVVGVCLGGSRARGTHSPDSDYDLGLYYRQPLDTAALRRLAAELTGGPVEVTEPGGWGPWVDGGGWLTVDGHHVDWIYRDLDRVHRVWQQCRAGQFEIGTQPGHPLGVYSHAYVGEVALGRVLADPGGELQALREQTRRYPEPLREALVDNARWEAPFILAAARKGAARGDTFYVAGCLFRAVGLLVHALHAHARSWLLNEKGAVRSAGELTTAPADFADRAHKLLSALGTTPDTLTAALDAADRLTTEVCDELAR